MCNAHVILQTSLLVSVRVGLGMDKSGIDTLRSRGFLEVDSNDGLTAAVTITYDPGSSETHLLQEIILLQEIYFITTNVF